MNFPFLFKRIVVCLALTATYAQAESSLSLTGQFTDLITKETKTRELEDGLLITYPVDHDDLIDLILPDIEKYRKARKKTAEEAVEILETVTRNAQSDLQKRIQKLLGLEQLSDDYSEQFDLNAADLIGVLEMWETWSGGLSEIHLWNQVGAKAFLDKETEAFLFDETGYVKGAEDEIKVFLFPPFFHRHGAGESRVRWELKEAKPFRMDLLHVVNPGTSTSTAATEVTKNLLSIHQLHNKLFAEQASNWVVHFMMERLLLHEIEAQFFGPNPPKALTKGMARLYLMVVAKGTRKDDFASFFPELFVFPLPAEREEAETFLRDLEKIDPLAPDVPEKFRTAAAIMLFKGLLTAAQSEKKEQLTFALFQELGIDTPEGGFDHPSFLAALRKTYPSMDKEMVDAKQTMIESMRKNFIKPEAPSPAEDKEEKKPLKIPEGYETEQIGELTVTFPSFLKKAAIKTAGDFSDQITRADRVLTGRFAQNLRPPVRFSEEDFDSLRGYGIPAEENAVALWSLQTAALSNSAKFVLDLAKSRKVEIWMKSELVALLKQWYTHSHYELSGESDLSYNFELSVSNFDVSGNSFEDFLAAYKSKEVPPLPIGIKDNEIATKSLEEQIKAIREGDVLIGRFAEAAETLKPEDLTGSKGKILTERQMYFLIVHEVFEGDLIRKTIASQDRRWFCDGLANLVAIRESDRRFGGNAGMEIFASLFPGEEAEKSAEFVALAGWKALERQDKMAAEVEGVQAAHYFYATKALLKATEGKDQKFIRDWLQKIQETKWLRTNSDTVVNAYKEMTGNDLYQTLKEVVPAATEPAP